MTWIIADFHFLLWKHPVYKILLVQIQFLYASKCLYYIIFLLAWSLGINRKRIQLMFIKIHRIKSLLGNTRNWTLNYVEIYLFLESMNKFPFLYRNLVLDLNIWFLFQNAIKYSWEECVKQLEFKPNHQMNHFFPMNYNAGKI